MNIKINPKVTIFEYEEGAVLYNYAKQKEYTVGKKECAVFNQIQNGTITEFRNEKSNIENKIIETFIKNNIVLINNQELSDDKKIRIEINLLSKNKNESSLSHKYSVILAKALFYLTITVSIFSALFCNDYFIMLLSNFKVQTLTNNMLIFYAVLLLSTIGHECSHAITAKKYGCHIVGYGLTLKAIFICAYVKIIGMGMCTRIQRIHIYFSGMIFNLFFSAISIIIGKYLLPVNQPPAFIIACIIINLVLVLENSLCLFGFDGNYIKNQLINKISVKEIFKEYKILIFFLLSLSIAGLLLGNMINYLYTILFQIGIFIIMCLVCLKKTSYQPYYIYSLLNGIISIFYNIITSALAKNSIITIICGIMICIYMVNFQIVWCGSLLFLINEKRKHNKEKHNVTVV